MRTLRAANDGAPGSAVAGVRQVEFPGPADRCPAVVHTELGVDVLGVSPKGVQGHGELASDLRAAQVGSEQPEHVQFAFAQWLDQALTGGRAVLGLVNGGQEPTDIVPGDPLFRDPSEQGSHRRAPTREKPAPAPPLRPPPPPWPEHNTPGGLPPPPLAPPPPTPPPP